MPYLEVNGAALRYELSGGGSSTMVLLHEMGGSLESWDLVAPRLAAERRVLRYDARGAGMSEKVRGRRGLDTLLADPARHLRGRLPGLARR
jgi:3-oxoadipate enol-lactonase